MRKKIPLFVRQYGLATVLYIVTLFALASLVTHTQTPEELRRAAGENMGTATVHVPVYNARYTIQNMDTDELVVRGAFGEQSFDLPPGNYRVDFGDIFGHKKPGSQIFLLEPNSSAAISGYYKAKCAAPLLGINIFPKDALYTIYDSQNQVVAKAKGAQFFTFEPGRYRVQFAEIPGFKTPGDRTFSLMLRATTNVNAFYGVNQ